MRWIRGLVQPFGAYEFDVDGVETGESSDDQPAFSPQTLNMHGGGTHNMLSFSPSGAYLAAFADVGGTRYRRPGDDQWSYAPTLGDNASRQVAGGCVTDSGLLFQLVGQGSTAGQLQEIDIATGAGFRLVSRLHVLANGTSAGDSGARPRPVGWMVVYDEASDLVYYCTEKGVGRYDRGSGQDDGIIALSGVSCRGFAHGSDAIVNNAGKLAICTRTAGMQMITNIKGSASATRISPAGWDRFEDAAWIDKSTDTLIAAGHERGVLLISGASSTEVTPSQASGSGAGGATTRWTAVAAQAGIAAIGSVNPDGGEEWIYRHMDVANATPGSWDNATPTPAAMAIGSANFSPANRVLGQSANGGANLTGTYGLVFDPADAGNNRLLMTGVLSVYQCSNFSGSRSQIAWESHNESLAMVSVASVHVSADGVLGLTMADHNSGFFSPSGLLSDDIIYRSVSGISDGWSVCSVGSGDDTLWVCAPTNDRDPFDEKNDVVFWRGRGVPARWSTTGLNSSLNGAGALSPGQRPRIGGLFSWDRKDGAYAVVAWADGLGFVRSTYALATDSWTTWQTQDSGPNNNLTSKNQLQERQIVGSLDGTVIVGVQLTNGNLWRSIDGGKNWSAIAGSIGTNQDVRTGRVCYLEESDTLVASDGSGLFRVNNVRNAPSVTKISGISTACQVAVDSYGKVYAHVRGPGLAKLVRFGDFAAAISVNDGEQVGSEAYQSRVGDLACCMATGVIGQSEYLITGYQGAGIVASLLGDAPAPPDPDIVVPVEKNASDIANLYGYGTDSDFGNNGRTIRVTNLGNSGAGSLRDALSQSGDRKILFDVAGVIRTLSPLSPAHGAVTVVGESAPAPGIFLQADVNNDSYCFQTRKTDMLFSNIGFLHSAAGDNGAVTSRDALSVSAGSRRVVFSQCSMLWGSDETVQVWSANDTDAISDITFQYCLIAEGLSDTGHSSGEHSKGIVVGNRVGNISLHHNYFARNTRRNPRVHASRGQIVNNIVIANDASNGTKFRGITIGSQYQVQEYDVIANRVYGTEGQVPGCLVYPNRVMNGTGIKIFAQGNIGPLRPSNADPERNFFREYDSPMNRPLESTARCTPNVITHADVSNDDLLNHVKGLVGNHNWDRRSLITRVLNLSPDTAGTVNAPPEGILY